MDNEYIILIPSGLGLFAPAFVALWFALSLSKPRADNTQVPKKTKTSFSLIAAYFVSNFLLEMTAWLVGKKIAMANHFIYGINFLVVSFCLLAFFNLQAGERKFRVLILLVYGVIVGLFFRDSLWHPDSRLSFLFVITYYASIAAVSALFIAISLSRHHLHPNKANINLGILFFVYHFFAMIITVFSIDIPAKQALMPYIYYINTSYNILFYSASAIIIFRINKRSYYDY